MKMTARNMAPSGREIFQASAGRNGLGGLRSCRTKAINATNATPHWMRLTGHSEVKAFNARPAVMLTRTGPAMLGLDGGLSRGAPFGRARKRKPITTSPAGTLSQKTQRQVA